jgi:hypothetical protein
MNLVEIKLENKTNIFVLFEFSNFYFPSLLQMVSSHVMEA